MHSLCKFVSVLHISNTQGCQQPSGSGLCTDAESVCLLLSTPPDFKGDRDTACSGLASHNSQRRELQRTSQHKSHLKGTCAVLRGSRAASRSQLGEQTRPRLGRTPTQPLHAVPPPPTQLQVATAFESSKARETLSKATEPLGHWRVPWVEALLWQSLPLSPSRPQHPSYQLPSLGLPVARGRRLGAGGSSPVTCTDNSGV